MKPKHVASWSGVLVLTAVGCASTSGSHAESANPMTQQVAAAQQASEQALARAQEVQKQATQQAGKAAEAQAKVQQAEEQLRREQELARQEQGKAQQLQAQAAQERAVADRQAREQQLLAERTLSQQTRQAATGQAMAAGVVTQVRPDEVVIQPQTGEALRLRVSTDTQVLISGQKSSAGKIKEGQQAQVSYKPSAVGPMAVSITIGTAKTTTTGTGSSSGGSSQPKQPGQ